MAGSVRAATKAVTTAVKKVTTPAADATKRAAVAADKTKLGAPGVFGLIGGGAGTAVLLLDAWKDTVGKQKGFDPVGALTGSTGVSIGGGAGLLVFADRLAKDGSGIHKGMRGAGVVLLAGGIIGAIGGALQRQLPQDVVATSNQTQSRHRFETTLPPAPANLAGVEVGDVLVANKDRAPKFVKMYVDPSTAKALPKDTTLGEAIGQARAATQADGEDFRSHAVVKAKDGTLYTIRLKGDIDQIDGPAFAKGTEYDERFEPEPTRFQRGLQALAGVEGYYVFPKGMKAASPRQYVGEIPWVTPELKSAKAAEKAAGKPATAPAAGTSTTPAATTTTGSGS